MRLLRRFFLVWSITAALPAAVIRINPDSAVGSVGGNIDFNVSVVDVLNLYAYQFDVTFDAGVLSASTVAEGTFLSSVGATFFVPGTIDNAAGTITFTVNTLLGPISGVAGAGTLAGIRFVGKAGGTSDVTLSNVLLLDSAGADIAATVQNGSVSVSDLVVPESGSAMLLLGGALMTFAARRWLR